MSLFHALLLVCFECEKRKGGEPNAAKINLARSFQSRAVREIRAPCGSSTPVPVKILILGLERAGKTKLVRRLCRRCRQERKTGRNSPETNKTLYSPTTGMKMQDLLWNSVRFSLCEVGGSPKLRPYWGKYAGDARGIIFVVDASSSSENIATAFAEMDKFLLTSPRATRTLARIAMFMTKNSNLSGELAANVGSRLRRMAMELPSLQTINVRVDFFEEDFNSTGGRSSATTCSEDVENALVEWLAMFSPDRCSENDLNLHVKR